ncbi:hypothetical protein DFH07DRAFT_869854 [Mycena maculata]|uniref:CRAL-TRIO domain-containing protein n=1 Tax=Mycena maculata TaxID=230809 RepID=A0AAD7IIR8_9AGAR|nr:hypothetical protein DFH07DRAFT_869854 [Mycena maculata]
MKNAHLVITTPTPGSKIAPIHHYSPDQHAQIDALRWYIDTLLLPETDTCHIWERRWLDQSDTHPRYMRATKWQLDDAKKRIRSTLERRHDYKPDLIPPEEVRIESETEKLILNGFDNEGRPILYVHPGRENTQTSAWQIRHLVWERAKDLMPPGQGSLAIIVDYKSTTLCTNPSLAVARKVLSILQHHYADPRPRNRAQPPPLLDFFYRGISPFLEPSIYVYRDRHKIQPRST